MKPIRMVDLQTQYQQIKSEIDTAIQEVIGTTAFINGPQVGSFAKNLQQYLQVKHVIPCANGTDALQIALMALDIPRGSEVILPAFNYVATAEVIAFLGLHPRFVDIDPQTFNLSPEAVEAAINSKTKAIMPVHLYGQSADMEKIMKIGGANKLFIIEDNAQSIGAEYTFSTGKTAYSGTMGHIGTTSFFPSKNLGCMGDGGAIFTNDGQLAEKLKMIANHGQKQKYNFEIVGINSRLDTIQAALLDVKLRYLNLYCEARQRVAAFYDERFADLKNIIATPFRDPKSTHVFHQYTLTLAEEIDRDNLQKRLAGLGIPTMVYYPMPLHLAPPYKAFGYKEGDYPIAEKLCKHVISLPIHTEMNTEQLEFIVSNFINEVNRSQA